MKKTIIFIVLAALCLNFSARSQYQTSSARSIKIGDTLPEQLWATKLQVLNHPNKKTETSLDEYKDKLIILDFWATWCTSCIGAMPKTHELELKYNSKMVIIGVTYEAPNILLKAITENKILNSIKPYTVYSDTTLKKYFPHQLVPHYVWINKGKVIAITNSTAINSEGIEKALQGQNINSEYKIDIQNFNYDVPLVKSQQLKADSLLLYSSAFFKYIPGLSSRQGIKVDSLNKTKRYYYINRPILALYADAIKYPFGNRIQLNLKNKAGLIRDTSTTKDWATDNTYSYELTVPLSTTKNKLHEIMLTDLNHYLSLNTSIVKQTMNCLAIVKINAKNHPDLKNRTIESALSQKLNSQIQSLPLQPIILDRTKGAVINISEYNGNTAELSEGLKAQGYALIPVQQKMKVLLIEDSNIN